MELSEVMAELARLQQRLAAVESRVGASAARWAPAGGAGTWHALGVEHETGAPLLNARSDGEFTSGVQRLLAGLGARDLPRFDAGGLRSALWQFPASTNLNDPRSAGWAWLCHADDPDRDRYAALVAPLARHRGMARPHEPLLYRDDVELLDWIGAHLDGERAPRYLLILGGPERVPFWFQSALAGRARVGRLELDVLEAVVEKVLRVEGSTAVPGREVLVCAPDHDAPTREVRVGVAEPLAGDAQREGWATGALYGAQATGDRVVEALAERPWAVALLTGHGVAERRAGEAARRAVNGALLCAGQGLSGRPAPLLADALPVDVPVVEGGVVVQLSCFSYGTPAASEYAHWLDDGVRRWAEADFVAAWPRRLLAHPRGPVAFVGHLDLTWVRTLTDPDPAVSAVRSRPLREAYRQLLSCTPVGQAMSGVHARYHDANSWITHQIELAKRTGGGLEGSELAQTWVTRNDARNFLVYGDPAARVWRPA